MMAIAQPELTARLTDEREANRENIRLQNDALQQEL
jgi:hypothetical protein